MLEASRETGWSSKATSSRAASSNATQATPQRESRATSHATPRREPYSEDLANASGGSRTRAVSVLSNTGNRQASDTANRDETCSLLMEQGAEAAEKLMEMLAETEHAEDEGGGRGEHDIAAMARRAGWRGKDCHTSSRGGRGGLESVSEHAAAGVPDASCSMCCDSSAIQRYFTCLCLQTRRWRVACGVRRVVCGVRESKASPRCRCGLSRFARYRVWLQSLSLILRLLRHALVSDMDARSCTAAR